MIRRAPVSVNARGLRDRCALGTMSAPSRTARRLPRAATHSPTVPSTSRSTA